MYPSIDIHAHTHTRYMHKLFVHYTVASRFFLRNRIEERPSSSTYVLFFQTCISFFSFINNIHTLVFIFLHLPAKKNIRKKKKDFICIDDNDDDLYVLHLTATGEVQQWNAFVDADHRWDRENECVRKRERERREERG